LPNLVVLPSSGAPGNRSAEGRAIPDAPQTAVQDGLMNFIVIRSLSPIASYGA
jgi:hypothetical protein